MMFGEDTIQLDNKNGQTESIYFKYLKYKNKYIALQKKLIEGTTHAQSISINIDRWRKELNESQKILTANQNMLDILNDKNIVLSEKLTLLNNSSMILNFAFYYYLTLKNKIKLIILNYNPGKGNLTNIPIYPQFTIPPDKIGTPEQRKELNEVIKVILTFYNEKDTSDIDNKIEEYLSKLTEENKIKLDTIVKGIIRSYTYLDKQPPIKDEQAIEDFIIPNIKSSIDYYLKKIITLRTNLDNPSKAILPDGNLDANITFG
jgi:hypothetical protein